MQVEDEYICLWKMQVVYKVIYWYFKRVITSDIRISGSYPRSGVSRASMHFENHPLYVLFIDPITIVLNYKAEGLITFS